MCRARAVSFGPNAGFDKANAESLVKTPLELFLILNLTVSCYSEVGYRVRVDGQSRRHPNPREKPLGHIDHEGYKNLADSPPMQGLHRAVP